MEQLLRGAELLQHAVAQDGHALPERHRLDLVVGDVDRRDPEPLVHARELGAHRRAELRVEVGERLVEQEHLRLAHERAAHRDPLALAARQLRGAPGHELPEAEHGGHLGDAALDLLARRLALTQPEGEVLGDGLVG